MKTLSIVVATAVTFALFCILVSSVYQHIGDQNKEVQELVNKSHCYTQTDGLGVVTYCKDSDGKSFRINKIGYDSSYTLEVIYLDK